MLLDTADKASRPWSWDDAPRGPGIVPGRRFWRERSLEKGTALPTYVVANVRVRDAGAYEQYKQMVPATIEHFGGRYLARGGQAEVIEGDLVLGRTIILEFPSYEDARQWYSSAEYAAAKVLRQASADGELIFIDGL